MWLKVVTLVAIIALSTADDELLTPKRLYKVRENDQVPITSFRDPTDGIDYRLPNDTIPLSYHVSLSTEIHRGVFDFDGTVTIRIRALQNTPTITMHYRELTIVNVNLFNANNVAIQPNVPTRMNETVEFLIITPSTPLAANTEYIVVISYKGILRDDEAGFYRSSYIDELRNTKWLATTQFESSDARHGFPCYDEPAIRSAITIEIRHHQSYSAISNMPVGSRINETGTEYAVTKFMEIPSVQTYIVAFTVSDFTYDEDLSGPIPQRVYARPQSISNGEGKLAVKEGVAILTGFENYLGVNFTLPKMDQAAIPDFAAGAMENWGLVTYREEYLLYDEKTATTRDRENVIGTIAHEYAHQWFGDLVSPAWWSFLWLNEGFATLYGDYLPSLVYPEDRWTDTFVIDTVQNVLVNDASPTIRPMTYYVENPDRVSYLFDNVAYSKSGSVLKMFQYALGLSTWSKGLNKYLNARGNNYGTPEFLHTGLQSAFDEDNTAADRVDVNTVMTSWEIQSGFPLISVSRSGNQLTFEQKRFFYNTTQTSENIWWVPINYVVGSNPNFTVTRPDFWIEAQRSKTIQSGSSAPKAFTANDWIVVNIQQSSYYRVNYDNSLWNAIISQLNPATNGYSQIHLLNRAQLIDDSYNLARAGFINYDVLLGIMNYLEKETDYIPWASANRANTMLNRWLAGTAIYPEYQAFMAKNIESLFDRLGIEPRDNDPKVDRYARTIAINLACQFQLESCLNATSQKLQNMLTTGVPIHQDYPTTIYCNGMRKADDFLFFGMLNKMFGSSVQLDRNRIIDALGCTQNPTLLLAYLNLAITPGVSLSNNEKARIISSSVSSGELSMRTMMSIKFTQENSQALSSAGLINTMCSAIAARIHNQDMHSQFMTLLTDLRAKNFITVNQQSTFTSSAGQLIQWQDENLGHVESFFAGLVSETTTPSPTTPQSNSTNPGTSTTPASTNGAQNIALSSIVLTVSVVLKYFFSKSLNA